MPSFNSLAAFAGHLAGMVVAVEHAKHQALEEASKLVLAEAKSLPGHPQPEWPPLAASTIARKTQPASSVLLETGKLRDSYQRSVGRNEARVGSNEDTAVFHELGTSKMPPRPVLITAARHEEGEIRHLLGRRTMAVLTKP